MLFTICYYTCRINIWQLRQIAIVKQCNMQSLTIRLFWYRKVYIKTLLYLLQSNKHLGYIFLSLLLTNFPSNCFVLIRLMNRTDQKLIASLITIVCEQAFIIVGIHWFIASINYKFDTNLDYFITNFVANNQRFTVRNNIKFNLFIQTYRTTKRNGFTYGCFGYISMLAFAKVKKILI